MESGVGQMIAVGTSLAARPPHPVFEPENAVQQRVILLVRAEFKPDSQQAVERLQAGFGQVAVIVPERTPA